MIQSIIVVCGTLLGSLLTFFLALRAELKKNNERILKSSVEQERRHASHEQRLSIITERMAYLDNLIAIRMEDINRRLLDINRIVMAYSCEAANAD